MTHFINGKWIEGGRSAFKSTNPATGELLWEGNEADQTIVVEAVNAAKKAFGSWKALPFETRASHLETFGRVLTQKTEHLAESIAKETGKPLWESRTEVASMINKIKISIDAYKQRCPDHLREAPQGMQLLHHRPHGVMGVLGPYNFPGHLPNGHIVPALLAGNTVVFKASELTPLVAEETVRCWQEAEIPAGVINLVQGGKITGKALVDNDALAGLLFTGSWNTGLFLSQEMAKTPNKILALEMGGNNPLVIGTIKDLQAASYLTIQSSFLTAGQRCTCARRLIVQKGKEGDAFIQELIRQTKSLTIGSYTDRPEPFMGPMISAQAAKAMLETEKKLKAIGGIPLLPMKRLSNSEAFITPGIIDVTSVNELPDEEHFGPLLQVIRVNSFNQALSVANQTKFGLSAGLLSDVKEEFNHFMEEIRAGVVNWNTPTTGAISNAPFGGIGCSGNNRPSAFYAADYCSYPVASITAETPKLPKTLTPGITL